MRSIARRDTHAQRAFWHIFDEIALISLLAIHRNKSLLVPFSQQPHCSGDLSHFDNTSRVSLRASRDGTLKITESEMLVGKPTVDKAADWTAAFRQDLPQCDRSES